MSVKVEVNNSAKTNSKFSFPVLAKSISSDVIVYFTSECTGLVLDRGRSSNKLLSIRDNFVSIFNKTNWEILPIGSRITLTLIQE